MKSARCWPRRVQADSELPGTNSIDRLQNGFRDVIALLLRHTRPAADEKRLFHQIISNGKIAFQMRKRRMLRDIPCEKWPVSYASTGKFITQGIAVSREFEDQTEP